MSWYCGVLCYYCFKSNYSGKEFDNVSPGDLIGGNFSTFMKPEQIINIQFSCSFVSDFLQSHGLEHAGTPCLSATPWVYSNSCPLSWWCHLTVSSSIVPFFSCLQSFPASVFSNESLLLIRCPKYWSFSFSISPSKEYSGLIFFRTDWIDVLAVQGTLKSLLHITVQKHQFFGAQPSLYSNSHIHTWPLEKA